MICDTDTDFLGKLAIALHHNFDPCSVEYMYGPSALEVSLRSDSGGADVLLTEIELRGYNAISIIAQYLKESSPLQIIYMTPKIEYCTEVYETRHCGFLLKPIRLERLVRDVQRALRLLEEKKAKGIVVQRGSSLHILSPQSLLYEYDAAGNQIKVTSYDSENRFQGYTIRSYNNRGQVVDQKGYSSDGTLIEHYVHTYAENGMPIRRDYYDDQGNLVLSESYN